MAPKAGQAREQMLQLRQFNLQFPFARPGALRENVQDERRAVEHFAIEHALQIPALGGRKFIIEYNRVHLLRAAASRKLAGLAAADKGPGHGRLQFLRAVPDDLAACRGRQLGEFLQGILRYPCPA